MSDTESEDGSLYTKGISERIFDDIDESADLKYSDLKCIRRRSKQKADSHRKGPAPLDDQGLNKKGNIYAFNTLDSDLEDITFEENNLNKEKEVLNRSLASCRQLIVYFSKRSKAKDEDEMVDLNIEQQRVNITAAVQSEISISF